MAMLPQAYSLNSLAVELGMTQRTVAGAMRDVPADAHDGQGRPQWRLRTALAALGFSRGNGGTEYEVSRSKWMAARAEEAALSLEERRGRLVETEPLLREIQQRWTGIIYQVRTRFLAIPSRLASRHAQLKTPQDTFSVSMKLVRETLNLLASNSEKATALPAAIGRRHQRAEAGRQPDKETEDAVS